MDPKKLSHDDFLMNRRLYQTKHRSYPATKIPSHSSDEDSSLESSSDTMTFSRNALSSNNKYVYERERQRGHNDFITKRQLFQTTVESSDDEEDFLTQRRLDKTKAPWVNNRRLESNESSEEEDLSLESSFNRMTISRNSTSSVNQYGNHDGAGQSEERGQHHEEALRNSGPFNGTFRCRTCKISWEMSYSTWPNILTPDHCKCCKRKILPEMHLTPYQGKWRRYGGYQCRNCNHTWSSAGSWANNYQKCRKCNKHVYPHTQERLKRSGEDNAGSGKPHQQDGCSKCEKLGHSCLLLAVGEDDDDDGSNGNTTDDDFGDDQDDYNDQLEAYYDQLDYNQNDYDPLDDYYTNDYDPLDDYYPNDYDPLDDYYPNDYDD